MADAADGHDPGAGRGREPIKDETGEREVTQVVGGEGPLKALGRAPARNPRRVQALRDRT
jgi:hypothetical protein